MKITEEQFDKLKQLDRIEYNSELQKIKQQYSIDVCFTIWIIPLMLGVFSHMIKIEEPVFAAYLLIAAFVIALFDVFLFLVHVKFDKFKTKQLNERYFKIETK